jgi:hypothetical protein
VALHQALEPTTTRVGDEKANLRKISMDLRKKKIGELLAGMNMKTSHQEGTSCKILFII